MVFVKAHGMVVMFPHVVMVDQRAQGLYIITL
jgi:hypothetical protein